MPDMPNPFSLLGATVVGKAAADAWTGIMMMIWSSGLWFFKFVLRLVDAIMTPDISAEGPAGQVYQYTFWLGMALLSILLMVQLGIAAFRRDGQSLGQVLVGVGQFVVMWAAWLSYAAVVLVAASGIAGAILQATLGIGLFSGFDFGGFTPSPEDVTDAMLATVLGFMGLFVWLGGIAYLLVMLARAGALLVLVATAPVAAAGLANTSTKSWFWRSFRWFHAAALTPVLMALVLGIGVKLTSGVVLEEADGFAKTLGTAIPGVFLICISCFSPLALFKLLAFVDPGTSSGAAMRTGWNAAGGMQGLLNGAGGTNAAASTTDGHGRSQAEVSAEGDASARASQAAGSGMQTIGSAIGPVAGAVGGVAAAGLGLMVSAGTKGAVVGADLNNQMGVGSNTYVPDFAGSRPSRGRHPEQRGEEHTDDASPETSGGGDRSGGGAPVPPAPPPPQPVPSAGPGGPGAGPVAPAAAGPGTSAAGGPAGAGPGSAAGSGGPAAGAAGAP